MGSELFTRLILFDGEREGGREGGDLNTTKHYSPHCRAVKVDHQPLAGVEGDGVGELDAFHPLSKLGTHEGRASVGRVHMEPELLLLRIEI